MIIIIECKIINDMVIGSSYLLVVPDVKCWQITLSVSVAIATIALGVCVCMCVCMYV